MATSSSPTMDNKFPLPDMIERFGPDLVDGELRAYAASSNPAIKADKLVHFMMGVFWKASIHSWGGKSKMPRIELGRYREGVRAFLLGKAPFPSQMGLVLSVMPREKALVSFSLPYRNPIPEFHSFTFHIPGVLSTLCVGKNLGSDFPATCFATNPAHPILVADLARDIASVGASIFGKARKSRKLIEYIRRRRS